MAFSILDRKDLEVAPFPLLLVTVTWKSGQVLRLCTNRQAVAFGGQTYQPRILNADVAAQQILSEQGIDHAPSLSLKLADADKWIYSNHERPRGFKGARVVAAFAFYDVVTGEYSSDSYTKFVGTCDAPSFDEATFTVAAKSRLNLTGIQFPRTRIQRTCPWYFPSTAAERQAAADDPTSRFFRCGYSPDASGANARGNSGFTDCDYTAAACSERGMYSEDSSSRHTGRFGGIQWVPVETLLSKSYRGEWETIQTPGNDARYNDFVPLIYGTVLTDPSVLNFPADANYTKCEVLLCEGEIDTIQSVIVNDVEIPHTFDDTEMSTVAPGVGSTREALRIGFWKCVNRGDRDGSPNADALYDGKGDPYGSLAVIEIVTHRSIAAPGSAPRVKVIMRGPKIDVNGSLAYTENPAWIVRDVLRRCGWVDADLDMSSFAATATHCGTAISYKDQFGNTATHPRFEASLLIRQRKTAADILRGLRNANRLNLVQDWSAGGKLQLSVRSTLAQEQPAPIAGSNYNTAVASKLPSGAAANGYVAYHFDEGSILPGEIACTQKDEVNRVSLQFQNRDNRYSIDSVGLVDLEDVERVGSERQGAAAFEGIINWDQARRAIATVEAEGFRGNPRNNADGEPTGDTGGTIQIELVSTFRVVHLRPGHLCLVSYQQLGLDKQLFRVARVQPAENFAKFQITLAWHNDEWYLDTYGQAGQPRAASNHRSPNQLGVRTWAPNDEQPSSGDAWLAADDFGFRIAQRYAGGADGSAAAILSMRGKSATNKTLASSPPLLPLQGTTAGSGGAIPGGRTYFVGITSGEALSGFDGYETPLSQLCAIAVPAGSDTNTITVPTIVWDEDARQGWIYAGIDRTRLVRVGSIATFASGAGPTSVTISNIPAATAAPPDPLFDHLEFEAHEVKMAGVWTAEVDSATSTTITVRLPADVAFVANEWAGRDISVLAVSSQGWIPRAHFHVTGNSTDGVLDVSGPDPTALWTDVGAYELQPGDVVVMRAKFTTGSDYLEDAKLINALRPDGLDANVLAGSMLRVLAGAGTGVRVPIVANDATKIYVDLPEADSTTRAIAVGTSRIGGGISSGGYDCWDGSLLLSTDIQVPNIGGSILLISGLAEDIDGSPAQREAAPIREIYIRGSLAAGTGSTVSGGDISFDPELEERF